MEAGVDIRHIHHSIVTIAAAASTVVAAAAAAAFVVVTASVALTSYLGLLVYLIGQLAEAMFEGIRVHVLPSRFGTGIQSKLQLFYHRW